MFNIDLYDIPRFVSDHLVRHIHAQPFVSTGRHDIIQELPSRHEQRMDDLYNMRLFLNAQEVINISKVRLCRHAEKETRAAWEQVINSLALIEHFAYIMFDLTHAICKMDKKAVIDVIESAYRGGIDLKQFVKNYNNFVLDLTVYDIIRTFDYIKIPAKYEKRMKSYSKEDFSYFTTLLNEIINLNSAIKYETMPKPIILSTLILLCSEA
jgi:hypothetical protein